MATCSSMIVPEVLKKDNYIRWSILMRHYLLARDLWDVVDGLNEMPGEREWVKKNALALHSIKISCGAEMFDRIKEMDSAKDAWNGLALMQQPPVYHDIVELQEVVPQNIDGLQEERLTGQHQILHNLVRHGEIDQAKQFLRDNPGSRFESILDSAIHVAITAGRKDMARYLYKETPLQCLHGDRGFSLLQECINKKMFDIRVKLYLIKPRRTPACAVRIVEDRVVRHQLCRSIISTFRRHPPDMSQLLDVMLSFVTGGTFVTAYVAQQCDPVPVPARAVVMCLLFLLVAIYRGYQGWTLIGMLIFPLVTGHKLDLVGQLIAGLLLLLGIIGSEFGHDQGLLVVETLIFLVGLVEPPILDPAVLILGQPLLYLEILHRQDLRGTLISGMPLLLLVTFLKMDLRGVLAQLLLFVLGLTLAKGNQVCQSVIALFCCLAASGYAFKILLSLSKKASGLYEECYMFLKLTIGMSLSILLLGYIREMYSQKLKDEYARKVIHVIQQQLSKLNQNQFVQSRAVEASFQAIKNDNPDIVIAITKANKNILWSSTDPEDSTSIFACAVTNRQEKVAQFLQEEFGASRDRRNIVATIDEDGNNVLHVAASLAPHSKLSHISGAALQLQSELRWFKSVEAIVPWFYRDQENKAGETPFQVFTREHKDLLKEAEQWMKKTAESSTVVGALIITIMFATAFTVPGGNDQNTGFPIFLNSTGESSTAVPFRVFIVSDAISLFTASGSVLMFLGILTSRYAYHDFLISLPLKLIIGVCSLFISIATMAVAFCASLFIMLKGRLEVFIPVTLLAGIPIIFFMLVQSQLVLEIYSSTCRSHIFGPSFAWILVKYVKSRLFISRLLIRRPRDA